MPHSDMYLRTMSCHLAIASNTRKEDEPDPGGNKVGLDAAHRQLRRCCADC